MLITILLWLFFPVSPQACHPKKRSCTDFCDNFCMFCLLSISSALATSTFWRQVFRPPLFDSISLLTLHFLRSLPYHLLPSALALQISFSWLSIIPLSLSHRLLCLDLLWCLLFCYVLGWHYIPTSVLFRCFCLAYRNNGRSPSACSSTSLLLPHWKEMTLPCTFGFLSYPSSI